MFIPGAFRELPIALEAVDADAQESVYPRCRMTNERGLRLRSIDVNFAVSLCARCMRLSGESFYKVSLDR